LASLGLLYLGMLAQHTWRQVPTWTDSTTAARQALRAADNNYLGHTNLGQALEAQGDFEGAFQQYVEALKLRPEHLPLQLNASHALLGLKRYRAAERGLRKILESEPRFHGAQCDLGVLLAKLKRPAEALPYLRAGWRNPEEPLAKRIGAGEALAWILATAEPRSLRNAGEALGILDECLAVDDGWLVWNTQAAALAEAGRFKAASRAQQEALARAPAWAHEDLTQRLASYQGGQAAD